MPRTIKDHCTFYTLVRAIVILAVVVAFAWYVAFQSRLLIAGPAITLQEELATVQHSQTVSIEGTAHNVVDITLNGRNIFINESGSFEELLVLEPGYTIMTIQARDRYGRTTTVERSFMYSSSSPATISIHN